MKKRTRRSYFLSPLKPNRKKSKYDTTKSKSSSIPMKFRTLPRSFWQQPNKIVNNITIINNNNNNDENNQNNIIIKSDINYNVKNDEINVSDANTDLLFSLFESVEKANKHMLKDEYNTNDNNNNIIITKRLNRLTKVLHKNDHQYKVVDEEAELQEEELEIEELDEKDGDDPYLVNNNIRENLLLLLLPVKNKMKNFQLQQEQVDHLKIATATSNSATTINCELHQMHNNYSQILSQLVVQL